MKNLLLLICTFFPSYLRLAVWKTLGFQVGKKCHVSILSIVVADHIEIGYGSSIDSLTFIYKPSTLLIGDRARIGNFVRIIGGGGKVELGANFHRLRLFNRFFRRLLYWSKVANRS